MCMDHLPKQEIYGQISVVTLPTNQGLRNFESQSKTRPSPPNNFGPRDNLPGHVYHPIPSGSH